MTSPEILHWKQKPFPELARLAWPITVSMLSYSVMSAVDTAFAGRLGATAVGAVGFGGVVSFTLICFGLGLLRAAKVLVAQAVGAGQRERIAGRVGAAIAFAVALGLATAVFGQLVALGLPYLADGSVAVREARHYVALRLLGAPLVLVAFAIREVRSALGDTRSPMVTALVANALHIPLNFALIFGADLGITGAAVSTVLSQGLEALLLVLVQRSDGLGLRAFRRADVRELFEIGLPLGLGRLFDVATFTVLVSLVARVSDVDLAAHQIAHQINLFAILPMMAIGEAAAVLAGQAVGAGEHRLVHRVARLALVTSLAYGAFCALVYVVFGRALAGALTSDPKVVALAGRLLLVAAAWQAFDSAYIVCGAVLRSAGDERFTTIATVGIAWVVTPPLVVLLGVHFGLGALGGWLALLAEWAVGGAVLLSRLEGRRWLRGAVRARRRLLSAPGALTPALRAADA